MLNSITPTAIQDHEARVDRQLAEYADRLDTAHSGRTTGKALLVCPFTVRTACCDLSLRYLNGVLIHPDAQPDLQSYAEVTVTDPRDGIARTHCSIYPGDAGGIIGAALSAKACGEITITTTARRLDLFNATVAAAEASQTLRACRKSWQRKAIGGWEAAGLPE